jgi:membrane-bound ClpP family serine protease
MILMPIVMVAPILALPLFYYFPLGTALPIYIVILIASVYCNVVMVWSMRAKAKSGVNAMIGKRALVIEDIAPEGKVRVWGEIWTATGRNRRIPAGKEVKILDAKGLVLSVDELDEHEVDADSASDT